LKADSDLDVFALLKGNPKNQCLADISRDQISEIHLFFDYDGHATAASDEALAEMLEVFSEETEEGKLYISYPMVESVRHHHPDVDFSTLNVACKQNVNYKKIVHLSSSYAYKNIAGFSMEQWNHVVNEHCCKLNYLMRDAFEFPHEHFDQISILEAQLTSHINPSSEVAVLSAFPVFLKDYYGCDGLKKLISSD